MSGNTLVGARVQRREDPALLTGEADYTDDLSEPGMVYAAFLRSQYGHARIEGIDTSRAEAHDGVVAVYTAEDLEEAGVPGVVPITTDMVDEDIKGHPVLAKDKVLYQGQTIAVVVAEERYVAHDALDLIEVDYERLDSVVGTAEAVDEDAPTLHEAAPGNVAFEWDIGDEAATAAAFDEADHVVELDLTNNRLVSNPIEPRAALAEYRPSDDELFVRLTTQNPHIHRTYLSQILGFDEQRIRVAAPEVGGGFGTKGRTYPDDVVATWCAIDLERPVKWRAVRTEAFLADTHARDHVTHAELAVDADGSLRGLRADTYGAMGAYVMDIAPVVHTGNYGTLLSGQYEIPEIYCSVTGTFTNTTPVHAYRGAGRPEACYVVERLVDLAADELGMDPAELRRRNFLPPEDFPYQTPVGAEYDSGNYEAAFDKALDLVGYDEFLERQETLREEGQYLGIGLSCFVESAGAGPSSVTGGGPMPALFESSVVRFHPSGGVTAYVGTSGHGQGHDTTYAQIVSDRLGVDYDDIEIVESDTEEIPYGSGTYASRSTAVGGGSLAKSTDKIIDKARRIAAHQLEVADDDLEFEDGEFTIKGAPGRSMTIREVASEAFFADDLPEGLEPGLEATTYFDPPGVTFPFGAHVAVVIVDPDSGEIEVERYVGVDDCGVQINPKLVEGQIHGSLAQGFAQVFYEDTLYDDAGNLITGSLQDYAVPKAFHIPEMETDETETPSPHNPLGAKGVGEAGTTAAPPAVVNAVVDALEPFGIDHLDMPLTPETVWKAVDDAR